MKKVIAIVFAMVACICMSPIVLYFVTLPGPNWEKQGSETTALALALYYESALAEPEEGMRAIYHVIDNRMRSKDFPNSIRAVVVEGAKPGKKGGCQFSFVCDGAPEHPRTLCELHPKYTRSHGSFFCERRWVAMYFRAVVYQTFGTSSDPTCGAVLYYTGPTPYWVGDFVPGTVRKVGSHTFGQSKYIGRDVAMRCQD